LKALLSFFTVLPVRGASLEEAAREAHLLPLVGIFTGLPGAILILLASAVPPSVSATLALGAVLLAAGLHAWASFLGAERIQAANHGRLHPADLVAVDDQGVFAFVAWDETTGEITRLYTHPRGQGRGAGRELLARAVTALRAAGCAEAWLNTELRNVEARRFYERQGWVEDGRPRVRDWHGARLVEPRYVTRL
jgi:ribosomal protein S18 acetylase RimI-like enzyme